MRSDGGGLYHTYDGTYLCAEEAVRQVNGCFVRVGTLADYLGVGTGRLVAVEDWTARPITISLRWEAPPPPEPPLSPAEVEYAIRTTDIHAFPAQPDPHLATLLRAARAWLEEHS